MKPAIAVIVALIAGVVLGVVVTRLGEGVGMNEGFTAVVRDPRAWLVFAAVLSLTARGPLVGAAAGLAAMFGLLAALQALPWHVDLTGLPREFPRDGLERAIRAGVEDTDWIDVPLLVGAAVVGAAVGTVRLALRTGRRLVLVGGAVCVLIAAVIAVPPINEELSRPEVAVIK